MIKAIVLEARQPTFWYYSLMYNSCKAQKKAIILSPGDPFCLVRLFLGNVGMHTATQRSGDMLLGPYYPLMGLYSISYILYIHRKRDLSDKASYLAARQQLII